MTDQKTTMPRFQKVLVARYSPQTNALRGKVTSFTPQRQQSNAQAACPGPIIF